MEELVAMAFSDAGKVWISPSQWRSTIVFKERLTTFQGFGTQGSGGVDTDILSTGFIIGVE
jgi:hypothetical protein